MECPRCAGPIKRRRTIRKEAQVIRYNACLKCGERFKSVEVPYESYQERINGLHVDYAKASNRSAECERVIDSIRAAFLSIYEAVEAQNRQHGRKDNLSLGLAPSRRRSAFL